MLSGPPAPFILFDDARPKGAGEARLYTDPVEIVTAHAPETVGDALDPIASAGQPGLHAAGTIAYEVGYTIAPRITRLARTLPQGEPLLWVALLQAVQHLSASHCPSLTHAPAVPMRPPSPPTTP